MKRDDFGPAPTRFLSLFSGIEAASAAWAELGWECAAVAEIDPFASAVLAHRHPHVRNLGDITKITEADIAALGRLDVMVFGSPCQDMSIAGKRKGLLNADGTVTRSGLFFAAFNIFMWAKKHCGCRFAVWENVPGSYSSNAGRDFASVVEFMAGLDDIAVPVHGWGTEGCALGDNGLLEWACLDAQWFGVAQRRRRVFAVLDTGDWASRQPVLLERESLRGDSAPRRETGQDVAGTVRASAGRRGGVQDECGLGLQPVILPSTRSGGAELGIDRSPTLTCNHEAPIVAGTLTCGGNSSGSATQQDAEADLLIPTYAIQAGALRENPASGPDGVGIQAHIAYTLEARAEVQAIAFSCKDNGRDATVELSPTLRSMGHAASHANGGGQMAVCVTGDVTHCLKAEGFDASEDGTGRGQPIIAFQDRFRGDDGRGYTRAPPVSTEHIGTLETVKQWHVAGTMAVRRLTPMECERLQGFSDGHTQVPFRNKLAADGPRYKALGNSMAVPVMAWIGSSIQCAMEAA